jgi:hypothetical protein
MLPQQPQAVCNDSGGGWRCLPSQALNCASPPAALRLTSEVGLGASWLVRDSTASRRVTKRAASAPFLVASAGAFNATAAADAAARVVARRSDSSAGGGGGGGGRTTSKAVAIWRPWARRWAVCRSVAQLVSRRLCAYGSVPNYTVKNRSLESVRWPEIKVAVS